MYKYYILEKKNQNVQGVISDDNGIIKYENLTLIPVLDNFSGEKYVQLIPFTGSPVREIKSDLLSEYFGEIELTKDYKAAYRHAGGNYKAVANSSEA